jgi:hypothetical protein
VQVDYGELALREVAVPTTGGKVVVSAAGRRRAAALAGRAGAQRVVLKEPVTVRAGERLTATVTSPRSRGKA